MILNINRENVKEMLRNKGHFTGMQSSLTSSEQRRYLELEDIYISYEKRSCNLRQFGTVWCSNLHRTRPVVVVGEVGLYALGYELLLRSRC
jgi:hypothetical protein